MLDSLFEGISYLLNFFYTLPVVGGNYAIAIALLTCAVMVITTPLTLKGTKSMIEMQRLQPEIRRLQAQYKDDRQKLNEEMMRFYREHEINPVGGCLPMLIQLPVFSILFYVVRGLTNQANFVGAQQFLARYVDYQPAINDGFRPKYLDHSSEMYQSLIGRHDMPSFGLDLAISPSDALSDGFLTALPYVLIVAVIAVLSWYQQKQIMGRNAHAEVTPQQRMMMRLGPALYVMFAFVSPAALCVYFLVSTVWRVAQQAYITHALYKGEDSVGVQAQKAMAQARQERKQQPRRGGNGARTAAKGGSAKGSSPTKSSSSTKRSASSRNGSSVSGSRRSSDGAATEGASSGASAARAKPHPRSRKKKKRK